MRKRYSDNPNHDNYLETLEKALEDFVKLYTVGPKEDGQDMACASIISDQMDTMPEFSSRLLQVACALGDTAERGDNFNQEDMATALALIATLGEYINKSAIRRHMEHNGSDYE